MRKGFTNKIIEDLDRIKTIMDGFYEFNIFSRSRKRPIVDARRVFVALIFHKYKIGDTEVNKYSRRLTLKNLSSYMGFDHAQILHLNKTFKSLSDSTPKLVEDFNHFKIILPGDLEEKLEILLKERAGITTRLVEINYELKKLAEDEEKEDKDYHTVTY